MKSVWIIDPTSKYLGSVANLRPQELEEGTNLHQEIGEIPNMDTLVESMRKEGNDEAVKVVGRDVGQEMALKLEFRSIMKSVQKQSAILEVHGDLCKQQ